MCNECRREQYWTPNYDHPGDWNIAILFSPWARARRQIEWTAQLNGRAIQQPTIAECAALLSGMPLPDPPSVPPPHQKDGQ